MTYLGAERRKRRLEQHGYPFVVVILLRPIDIQEFCTWLATQVVYGKFLCIPSTAFLLGVNATYPNSKSCPYTLIRTVLGFESGKDALLFKLTWA